MSKRKEDGFNLSFLDVMACGLGAVLMILIVVKFNASSVDPTEETERLKEELAALQDEKSQLKKSLEEVNDNIKMEAGDIEARQRQIEELKIQQEATRRALKDKSAVVSNLETSVAATAAKNADDLIEVDGNGEEEYLIGLKVEGKQIGILIDQSGSMTEESIAEGIRRKIEGKSARMNASKWLRTKRIANWLLARLPKESKVSVVAFNDTATTLGTRPTYTAKVRASMKSLSQEISKLDPHNGTNLQAGLAEIKKSMPNMTDLYLITDGLPTLGEMKGGILGFKSCNSFFGKSKMITGECRVRLFNHSVNTGGLAGVKVHIILLPLEGDSEAPAYYWEWASVTRGSFISPAGSWP